MLEQATHDTGRGNLGRRHAKQGKIKELPTNASLCAIIVLFGLRFIVVTPSKMQCQCCPVSLCTRPRAAQHDGVFFSPVKRSIDICHENGVALSLGV